MLSLVAFVIADIPFVHNKLRFSPLIIGIILGMIYGNCFLRKGIPQAWDPGVKFASKQLLRLSIIFYGFRLLVGDIVNSGWQALVVDVIIVASVLILGEYVGRWLKMGREVRTLTSCGSAICGAAAVLGTEPVVRANSNQSVIAVATVVVYGTLSMFLYPLAYRAGILHLSESQMAVYTGATLHEVAHVAGAGASMGDAIAGSATITKMMRVILLAPVLIALGLIFAPGHLKERITKQHDGSQSATANHKVNIPWFAVLFLVMILVNSGLSYLFGKAGMAASYEQAVGIVRVLDDFALTMAMTAIGYGAVFANIRKAGGKAFLLALILYIWLVVGGYFIVWTIVPNV